MTQTQKADDKKEPTLRAFMSSVFLVALMSFSPSTALADWIATASIGAAIPSLEQFDTTIDGDSGYSIGGSLGMRFGDMIQCDTAELSYQSADQNDIFLGQYTSSALTIGTGIRLGMFGDGSKFHPYVSFGLGGSRDNFEAGGVDVITEWGFEWNAGGGVLFDVTDSVSVGARYRYRSNSFDEAFGVPISEVTIGVHNISFEIAFGG